jgi:hypothetical protein
MDVNNHPLNKAAWKWLKEARQPTPQHALYLLDRAYAEIPLNFAPQEPA